MVVCALRPAESVSAQAAALFHRGAIGVVDLYLDAGDLLSVFGGKCHKAEAIGDRFDPYRSVTHGGNDINEENTHDSKAKAIPVPV